MNYSQWLNTQPATFPALMDHHANNTPFQNPIIGTDQPQTYANVKQVIDFLLQMAYASYTEPVDFSMNESATWGFINVLECLTGAMVFEEQYRSSHDSDKSEREDTEKEKQAASVKPSHDAAEPLYHIVQLDAEGTESSLGFLLAPNAAQALAKTQAIFADTLKAGQSIMVRACAQVKTEEN